MNGPSLSRLRSNVTTTVLLWLAGSLYLALAANAQEAHSPLIQSFLPSNTGAEARTWITRQGPDGILYFGSNSLLSWDGDRWLQTSANGTQGLRGLDFDKSGKLWAASVGDVGYFERNSTSQWSYHSLLAQVPKEHANFGEVWHAFANENGALFIAENKILRWDEKNFTVWSFPCDRPLSAIRLGSDVYFHHTPTGLYIVERAGPRLVIPASILGESRVLWMESRSHGLLLATSGGLFTYATNQLTPYATEASDFIRQNLLTGAARLADGRLALGTFQGGILILKPDGAPDQILGTKDGLPTNSIYSLFVDRNTDLWVTSDSSIFRLSLGSRSTFFDGHFGLPAQPIGKIVRSNGRIHLATDNTVYEYVPEQNRFQVLVPIPKHMWELLPVSDGLLVGGMKSILKLVHGVTTSIYTTPNDVTVLSPSRFRQKALLISEAHSIVVREPDGATRHIVENIPGFATSIAEDNLGRLWLGTPTRSIMVAKPSANGPVEAVQTGQELGLPDNSGPGKVVAAADGTVLAFSSSGGWMLRPNATRFIPIEGFPAWSINAVSEVAADNSLWVIHSGIANRSATAARIIIENDRAVWQPHSIDGLWNIGTPNCILAEAGANGDAVLWVGGNDGLLRNVVMHGPVAPMPNPPLLRALVRSGITDELAPLTSPLPYSTQAIIFEFAAPEFARRPALHLETMLEGIDQHWVPADSSSRRELTALREGHYTFRVRVVAETGVTSPTVVSRFEITPPWWRTTATLVCALLALIPAGYGLYFWRMRRLRQRNAELETKVRERTEELAQASAAKTQFIANMSHDIRNPLNGIVGMALALEDTTLDTRQRELVATLRECTTYLSTLVGDVLDFASIEAGSVELRPGPFSPHELLRSIAAMFKMEAIASGATLHIETDPHLPAAYVGDAGRIQQILVNFLTNALKYAGGRIKLSATIPADAAEEIEFAVTDEGPGISAAGQRILFTKFTRLTDAQSKEITGTGLGLASCRLLAGLMSGSVGVRSRERHGARFFLRLPLEIAPAPMPGMTGEPPSPKVPALLPNCTVLLVEDTNYNAWAATAVLSKFGLTCERATTGAEAIKLFAAKRHNLVLLDRNLPDMDGTEVARRIRSLEANGPRAILLAVTAYCTNEDRALCLSAGMDAFVGKPLTPEKLRRVLTAAGRRHLAAASMHVSPDVASATGVDVSLLEYISDGTNQGLSRQIELFLTTLSEAERLLEQASREADFTQLAEAAHGILSHARLVGGASLATAAAGLERAARSNDREASGELLAQVRREIQSLTAVVRRHPAAERSV